MPFTKDGIKPDIIFNPLSIVTRMTMSIFFETMLSKICAYTGTIIDGTIFKKMNLDEISETLKELGFEENGTERLYNGMTGKYIDSKIFIGNMFYQRLQKFTIDTVYSHKTCPTDFMTGQPLDGKSASGGLKVGEMESHVLGTHAINFLREKLIDHSDKFDIYICKNCNKRAIVNETYHIYKCSYCGDNSNITRVRTTWSVKQLYDELESCNIGIKFFTNTNKYEIYLNE
jgi:DNA-directed RNA polymerase II subunit RPB2